MQQKSSSIYTNPTETPDEEEKRRYNEIGYWQETIRKHEKKEPPAETIEKSNHRTGKRTDREKNRISTENDE